MLCLGLLWFAKQQADLWLGTVFFLTLVPHVDVTTCKRFLHLWLFVRGILSLPLYSHHRRPVMRSFAVWCMVSIPIITPLAGKQPWWMWGNKTCQRVSSDHRNTTKQSTTNPVHISGDDCMSHPTCPGRFWKQCVRQRVILALTKWLIFCRRHLWEYFSKRKTML